MRIHRGLPERPDVPLALTVGNFDGIHRGHQAMLGRLLEAAEDLRLAPAVMTFDRHPAEFFAPHAAPPRLSGLRWKLDALRGLGIARTYLLRFDARLAAMPAETFVDEVLERRLGVRWVLIGDDFRFGKGRRGDLSMLRERARTFSVEAMRTVEAGGERVSSSAVRAALDAGEFERAASLLGRGFAIGGRVAHGEKLGRRLGFPTANIPLRHKPPVSGVFAVRVHGLGPTPRPGVASVGVRPTVADGARPLLEVHLFDFDQPIYGRRIAVEFMRKLRDEARYPTLDALARQIAVDADDARRFFAEAGAPAAAE